MTGKDYNHPLDNPMYETLSTRLAHFNEGDDILKMFPAEVSQFVGLQKWDDDGFAILKQQLPPGRIFSFIYHKDVRFPEEFEIILSVPIYQLICPKLQPYELRNADGIIIRSLTPDDVPQMLSLTQMTKPGPFFARTIEFGDYMGVFDGEKLVAMAGNRMQVPGFSEVSAICTHPDYLGKGYASFLASQACERFHKDGCIPFLHVLGENKRAYEVYKRMGFELRAEVYYKIFRLKE